MTEFDDLDIKASLSPTEIPLNPSNEVPDVLPQERVTGDILHGYGPRRGNLEKLLRYWRPIMRREGGFRRCRVILADHPELYPLEPLCAWLHHETTGLWPNEGCHHPGMKNCRKKLKGIVNGSIWTDSEWAKRLESVRTGRIDMRAPGGKLPGLPGKKGLMEVDPEGHTSHGPAGMEDLPAEDHVDGMHPEEWAAEQMDDDELQKSCVWALKGFMAEEPNWINHIQDHKNWEHVGFDEAGQYAAHPIPEWAPPGEGGCGCGGACGGDASMGGDCGCGCGGTCSGMKDLLDDLDIEVKVGKPLSARSIKRIKDAIEALTALLDETGNAELQQKAYYDEDDLWDEDSLFIPATVDELFEIKSLVDPVLEYHGLDSEIDEEGILVKGLGYADPDAWIALDNVLALYDDEML
jgi:hypothetical protein